MKRSRQRIPGKSASASREPSSSGKQHCSKEMPATEVSPGACETELQKVKALLKMETEARKRTEEALREMEARFRATLDNAAQGIVLTDDKGRFTQVNAAWEKMFGYTAEEALAMTHLDITHPDFMEVSNEKLMSLTSGGLDFYRMEKRYLRKDGTEFWGDLTVTPVPGVDRRVGAAVGIIVDITETKRAQQALQERDALISALYNKAAQARQ
jgi:sigma-54 dependent transcriptional regulator, acetoin dehydrogenase operon transcriptional activator AcoR